MTQSIKRKMFKIILLMCVTVAMCADTQVDHSKDPAFYRCPFSMFNAGRPVTNELGEVMYCGIEGATCPAWHFCSSGFADGRAVCCHILGV
ncbi:hypothetical protein DPMN_122125 [Dreissena polymorpha]|uniref:Uncharacterized protein n=1 Tax=Dreissena polymorpha TaxID=45954 RepID=A0A9D4GRU3_DREPO|nr:hypothetical protein DPMN_122125 [Dreissena polymorpha]